MNKYFITTTQVQHDSQIIVKYSLHSCEIDEENFVIPKQLLESSDVIVENNVPGIAVVVNYPSHNPNRTPAEAATYTRFFGRIIKDLKALGYTKISAHSLQTGEKRMISLIPSK